MLLFICGWFQECCKWSRISIHLMLLFIPPHNKWLPENAWFQYISCYCLSRTQQTNWKLCLNFNTSHVTVYPSHKLFITSYFQISIHLMLLFISIITPSSSSFIDFNTSHVTVYLQVAKAEYEYEAFQYISCYCLSTKEEKQAWNAKRFQYISCYCLSVPVVGNVSNLV